MSYTSKTGCKKSELEKLLKEAEIKAIYWQRRCAALKDALEVIDQARNPYKMEK